MNREFTQKLSEIVDEHLSDENFGPEQLAEKMGISHSTLHRKLKEITNQTISQFIREVRLNKAKDLLLSKEITISEIAYKVGFSSATYFNKCFHDYFGVAPGEFKKTEQTREQQSLKPNRNPFKLILWIVTPVLMLAIVFLFLNKRYTLFNKQPEYIVIHQVENLDSNTDSQWQANATGEGIQNNLMKISGLRVIDRMSEEQYQKVGDKLNAKYELRIRFQNVANNVILYVSLINSRDQSNIWHEKYESEWKEITAVLSEIALTIVTKVNAEITIEEKQRIKKIPKVDLSANDWYWKGREELWKFETDNSKRESLENAEKYFQKALKYDSKFALAYTGLAQVYRDKNYYKEYFSEDFLDSVIVLADRAVKLDNQLAEAYNLRGVYYFDKGNFEQALKEFDTALKYNPNLWEAYFFKGKLYWSEGTEIEQAIFNFHQALLIHRGSSLALLFRNISQAYQYAGFAEQAKYYLREALSLNQDSANYYNNLAEIENNNRNYKESIEFGIKAIQYDSTNIWILNLLGFNYSMVNNPKESLKYYKKMIEILQKKEVLNISNMHRVGYAYFKNGLKREANFYFNEQIKFCKEAIEMGRRYSSGFWAHYDLAAVYAFREEKEKAFEYLRIFNQKKNINHVIFRLIKDDPLLNNLRNEPEFQKIAAEVERKYLDEQERVKKWLKDHELL